MKKKYLPFLFGIILIVLLISTVYYLRSEIKVLGSRLDRIENKLGGSEKIGCREKESIEKVRRSVVRIIGGE